MRRPGSPQRNPSRRAGVRGDGGGPSTRGARVRPARAARGRRRLRGARSRAPGDRIPSGLLHHRQHDRRGGRRPGRRAQGLARARPVPRGGAVAAVAAEHRRERGTEPPPLCGPPGAAALACEPRASLGGAAPFPGSSTPEAAALADDERAACSRRWSRCPTRRGTCWLAATCWSCPPRPRRRWGCGAER